MDPVFAVTMTFFLSLNGTLGNVNDFPGLKVGPHKHFSIFLMDGL
jgi:hypothetical protein